MIAKSFQHVLSLSLVAICMSPLVAQSAEGSPTSSVKTSSTQATKTVSSSVAPPKKKVMTNLTAAAQRPNFSGKWVLDSKVSDPVDDILKAQGASWLERQAAKNVKITQDIKQDTTQVTLTVSTAVKSKTEVLKLDGSTQVSEGDRLGAVKTKVFWAEDGLTLVSVTEPTSSDQNFKELKVSRKLQDQGKTMSQLVEMKLKTGETLKANRVFRKVG